jgi:hypothetical protein
VTRITRDELVALIDTLYHEHRVPNIFVERPVKETTKVGDACDGYEVLDNIVILITGATSSAYQRQREAAGT